MILRSLRKFPCDCVCVRCVSISGIFVYSTCYRWIRGAVAPETEQGYRCPLWCPERKSTARDGPDKWIEGVSSKHNLKVNGKIFIAWFVSGLFIMSSSEYKTSGPPPREEKEQTNDRVSPWLRIANIVCYQVLGILRGFIVIVVFVAFYECCTLYNGLPGIFGLIVLPTKVYELNRIEARASVCRENSV